MSFLAANRLWLLLAVGALAVAYVFLQHRRRHYAARFTNLALLDTVAPRRPGWRRHVSAVAVGIALVALVVGLARPVRVERVPRKQAIVMLAIDVSYSMTATDVSPSRIEAATKAAKSFVSQLPSKFQVGLVAFDRSASVLATPTIDHLAVLNALDRLSVGQGTAGGEGLHVALDAVKGSLEGVRTAATASGQKPTATIVLLSDGATTTGRPIQDAAEEAKTAGVPVSTIAYGTPSGTVAIQGETVPVPSDPAAMKQVANTTGGKFFEATSAGQLKKVYQDIQARVGYTKQPHEILRWFFGIAFVALLAAVAASMVWSSRFL